MISLLKNLAARRIPGLSLAIVAILLASQTLFAQEQPEEDSRDNAETEYTITTLNYRVAVPEANRFVQTMEDFARGQSGYLVQRSGSRLVLRVPRSLGRKAIDQKIGTVPGAQILQNARETNEVTTRLVDLRAKYKVASQNLEKLRALSKTAGLDDLLDLEQALSRQLQEVEKLKGEMRYLEEMSQLFTLELTINEAGLTSDPVKVPIPWIRRLTLQGVLK